jgi:hypothetical protein
VDDILVLYTDGVTEASRDGELFGDERLESVVMRQPVGPESLPQLILAQVLAFSLAPYATTWPCSPCLYARSPGMGPGHAPTGLNSGLGRRLGLPAAFLMC